MAPRIAIVYYSMYGHIKQMADFEKAGIESAGGKVDVYQIRETLPQEVLTKMHAPGQDESIPFVTPDIMTKYDAFLFGIPTRYGNYSAQWKAFIDQLGGLWQQGALFGKYFGVFVSTATAGGGQETTAITSLSSWVHQGMIYVPLGYKETFGLLADLTEVRGGSPWGAGTFSAGDGSRQPTQKEKDLATTQGRLFYQLVSKVNFDWLDVPTTAAYNEDQPVHASTSEDEAPMPAHTSRDVKTKNTKPSQPMDTDDVEDKSGPCGLPKGCTVA